MSLSYGRIAVGMQHYTLYFIAVFKKQGVNRMTRFRTILVSFASIAVLATTALVFAHGGGLDSQGGHHNRKQGGYHFHRGPLSGQSFTSKSSAASALQTYYKEQSRKDEKEQRTTDKPKILKPLSADEKMLVLVQLLEKKQVLDRGEFEMAIKEYQKSRR